MRRCRKKVVGWVMLGWLFAQIVTVAHACPALTPQAQDSTAASAAGAAPMASDCAAMAKPVVHVHVEVVWQKIRPLERPFNGSRQSPQRSCFATRRRRSPPTRH